MAELVVELAEETERARAGRETEGVLEGEGKEVALEVETEDA